MPKTAAARAPDFAAAFAALKKLLAPYARRLHVTHDRPGNYYLETVSLSYKGKRLFFGAVQEKKKYVSFHLMPLYAYPELARGISPALKKRMQGKSCFNFIAVEKDLFGELASLVEAGFHGYERDGYL